MLEIFFHVLLISQIYGLNNKNRHMNFVKIWWKIFIEKWRIKNQRERKLECCLSILLGVWFKKKKEVEEENVVKKWMAHTRRVEVRPIHKGINIYLSIHAITISSAYLPTQQTKYRFFLELIYSSPPPFISCFFFFFSFVLEN